MNDNLAFIKPFQYLDEETGDRISVSISKYYSKLRINKREYFFIRETGEFDGSATDYSDGKPILIYEGE